VEKHRNGPIGKVELMFDENQTTFRTLETSDFGDLVEEAEVSTDEPPF
jgi:hypothetical protein